MAKLNYGGSYVNKTGDTLTGPLLETNGSTAAPSYAFSGSPTAGMFLDTNNGGVGMIYAGTEVALIQMGGAPGLTVSSGLALQWGSSGVGSPDTMLYRDAAGTLALRNGTAPQTYRVYNTYTDASNYEVGVFDWTSTVGKLTLGTAGKGTGAARDMAISAGFGGSGTVSMYGGGSLVASFSSGVFRPGTSGTVDIGSSSNSWRRLYLDYTNTATVGAVTINKARGRVNIAAAGTSVVVTNSLCTANAAVFCNLQTVDATAKSVSTASAAGSFTITLNAASTSQVSIDFFLVNTD